MGRQESQTHYLGSNLRLLSAAYNLTYSKIGERLGIHQSHVARMANYKPEDSRRPAIENLIGLAEIFETDLETLVRKDLVGELKARIKKK